MSRQFQILFRTSHRYINNNFLVAGGGEKLPPEEFQEEKLILSQNFALSCDIFVPFKDISYIFMILFIFNPNSHNLYVFCAHFIKL